MIQIRLIQCILLLMILPGTFYGQIHTEKDFTSIFAAHGVEGCFVLYNEINDTYIRHQPLLCDSGYLPASTFKIPHALIALEEGLIKDTNQIIPWDGTVHQVEVWNQDQTLKTAVRYSCVPVFVDFAEKIPMETYYKYVNDFDYGNKDLTGPPTRFWLAGQFRISANQQIDFLKKMYHHKLPVAPASIKLVKDIIVLENNPGYKLSGKTGGGMINDELYVMWLVGYVEKEDKVYYFALNFISNDFSGHARARYTIAKEILHELGVM